MIEMNDIKQWMIETNKMRWLIWINNTTINSISMQFEIIDNTWLIDISDEAEEFTSSVSFLSASSSLPLSNIGPFT